MRILFQVGDNSQVYQKFYTWVRKIKAEWDLLQKTKNHIQHDIHRRTCTK